MNEYSYFRVEPNGKSFDAIKTVLEVGGEIRAISDGLAMAYGAKDFAAWSNNVFVFDNSKDVPADFEINSIQLDNDDVTEVATFARAKAGTKTAFNVSVQAGKIASLEQKNTLEKIFKCGDMPEKELPAGQYSRAFVRSGDYICEWSGWSQLERPDSGKIIDSTGHCGGSNSRMISTNPLSYAYLDHAWYIRVPNDEKTGKPYMTPPDATPMKYAKMLKADLEEHYTRNPDRRRIDAILKANNPSGPR